jgi:O-succinylbenzoic acid--CoA ligase
MERIDLARLLGQPPGVAETNAEAVLIAEREPARFLAAFARAAAGRGPVFLADPAWGENERRAAAALVAAAGRGPAGAAPGRGWLMVPSGGSTGRIKFARHDEETLAAAVMGFCGHFRVTQVDWLGLLPLHHVSGLMAWFRTLLTGGDYYPWEWKRLEAGDWPERPAGAAGYCVSLVPTQLHRLLAEPAAVDRLRAFDIVFLGGGPAWPALLEQAARSGIPLSLTYGMTETAAMVAALRPSEFAAGGRSSGTVLPHARIDLAPDGRVMIGGPSLFRGYYPDWRGEEPFLTDDLARWDEHRQLHLLGRTDAVIITGGEKVDPAEVEGALRASGLFADLAVIGVDDPEWGQAVTVCYPGEQPPPDFDRVKSSLVGLAAFKRPRRYVPISPWPRNPQGKLNRAALQASLPR